VAAYAAGGLLVRGHPFTQSVYGNVGLLLPALAVCAILIRRRREWAGLQRLYWETFLLGMGLWVVGHVGWAFSDLVLRRPSWLQWHTMFSLCGGLATLVALIARPHRGIRKDAAPAAAVDVASYAMLGGFIFAYFVLVPSVVPAGQDSETTLLALVQALRLLLLATLVGAAVVAKDAGWSSTYARLAVGVGIGFFLRIFTSLAIASGTYRSGTLFDLAWIVPFVFYAWAAAEAPPSPQEDDSALETPLSSGSAIVSAIPVFLVPVVGFGLLRMQSLGEPGDSFRILLTTLVTIAGLGLLTLRLSVQRSELQRADARLKLLAAAIEQTGDLILITRADGRIEHANDAFVKALGYPRADLLGTSVTDLLGPGFERLGQHVSAEVRQKGLWRGTLLRRRRDGSTFPAASTVVALRDGAGGITHFVGVERDVTEELRLRDQLVQSERLSAIGELVAGVAHEINNPLQTIVGCVELLLDQRPSDETRDLELVKREATRAGQIVRNLLAFVRRSSPDRVVTDLNELARATAELREYSAMQRNVTLIAELAPGMLPVLANREELQQVLVNLVLNAEQALTSGPGSGHIVLRTRTDGHTHVLEVQDDGPGVPPEMRGRIFEPFFTTKSVGEGTGLGLSIAHGIATSHGGTLELVATERGACFRFTVPAYTVAPAPAAQPNVASRPGV
jgi:PAS domain S-box-containing protein